MELRREIVFLMNQYLKKHGVNPTKLYLTRKEENEMLLFPEVDFIKGPRHTFKGGIGGMKITWDAKEFKVE